MFMPEVTAFCYIFGEKCGLVRLEVRLRPDWLPPRRAVAERRVARVLREPVARVRRLRPREVPVRRVRVAPTPRDRDLRLLDLRPLSYCSNVSRFTSLLKLLFFPLAVLSCTSRARFF
jgi:hypothetical protein